MTQACRELGDYLYAHDLDPDKDWTEDPVHGQTIRELIQGVKIATKKHRHEVFISDEAKREQRKAEIEKYQREHPESHPVMRKKKPTMYSYPKVDGDKMTPELKKKYRRKMRKLLAANMNIDKAQELAARTILGISLETAKPKKKEKKKNKRVPSWAIK